MLDQTPETCLMPKKNPDEPKKDNLWNAVSAATKMEIGNCGKNSIIARDLSRNKLI